MKFTEALEQKSQYGDTIQKDGRVYYIHVAPKNLHDQLEWIRNYDEDTYDDNTCLQYSKDNEFQLYMTMSNDDIKKLKSSKI